MSPRKCFLGCEGKLSLFAFPKEESARKRWTQFLFPGKQQPGASVFLCSRHFTEDCFLNRAQYEAGFSNRLVLKDGAAPSVKTEAQASTSQQTCTTQVTAKYRHTGCQTVPEPTVSVATQFCPHKVSIGTQFSNSASTKSAGTQLSYSTLKHVRSKGTQVSSESVGTDTTQQDTGLQLSSTFVNTAPSLGVRAAKRPRLELLKEKEDEETISDLPQPPDSTYEPGDSTTKPSDISETESTSDYNDPKYIVFDSCLRDLFQTCPVCKRDCEVQRQRQGTCVSFSQLCPNCQYTRKWQSQPMRGSTPVGNLQMSAAVYFTGGSFKQLEKICKAINLQMFQFDTFRRHAKTFLEQSGINTDHSIERVHYPPMMTSPNRVEQETSVQSSENGTEPGKEDAAVQRQKSPGKWTATKQSENKENRDIQEDEDQEFTTSLSVGDGRFLVDLGSSSEFIIDEECILQLFKSCRECNKQCTVRKNTKGLKIVISQACWSCHNRSKWTNLPSDDED